MTKKVSIVIPCYFNESNLSTTFYVIQNTVFNKRLDIDFELIFVDDGSKDNTLLELKKIQNLDSRVRIVKLSRNFGEFRAIVAGLSHATGDAAVVISADLQDPPELIPDLIDGWLEGHKVVIAARSDREESWLKKTLANTYYAILRKLVIKDFPKYGFDFFLLDRQVIDVLTQMSEKNSSIYVQIIWTGYTPKIIEYVRKDREKGKSMWTYAKRINLFIDTFIVFSYTPIRVITGLGLIMSIVGFISSLYFIIEKIFFHVNGNGWTSLIVAILVLSGVQLVMLGIIGEYLWRNLDETRKRPLYIVDEIFEPIKNSD